MGSTMPNIHTGQGPLRCIAAWMLLLVLLIVLGCNADPPPSDKVSAPAPATPQYEGTIVAVGDSLTAGLGVAEELAYPDQLADKLNADGYHFQVINAGVSGETSSGTRARIQWVIASLKPDIVILEIGANDGLRGIDPHLLETNLNQICTILTDHHIQILMAGMLMLPNLGPEYTQAFSVIYPRVAQKHPVIFMPFFLKEVAGDPHLNQPDRLHPNAQGYRRIVDNIYPYVQEVIAQHRAAAH
jgi:acyl-CoA thioesterase I